MKQEQLFLENNREMEVQKASPFFVKKVAYVKKKYLTPRTISYKIFKVIKMKNILEQALLYDFYGELLTSHQKEVYEQFVLEDLSLSEIAESAGISRQGVHDLIKRCNKTLEGYEAKLHLVEKFLSIREKVQQMNELLEKEDGENKLVREIRQIAGEIIEEL